MRKRLMIIVLAMMGMVIPGLALAYGVQADQNVTVPKGETRSGTFYAAGQTVTIDGDVDGDLICAGSTVSVNGAVHGDVICAGQLVSVNGPVDGSVRLAGQSVSVNGPVGRNATLAGQAITVGSSAHISGDLGVWGQTASVDGTVDKAVYGGMQSLSLGATVGPVDVHVQNLALGSNANVRGNLRYVSEQTFAVDKAHVSGEIQRVAPPVSQSQREAAATSAGFALRLYWIVAGLVTALVVVWLVPRLAGRVSRIMRERPVQSLGWGALVVLLGPVLTMVLILTIIGIPLAVLWFLAWCLVLSLGGLFAGVAVGQWLLARADWHKDSLPLAALFGVPLAIILFSIPGLGGLVMLVAICWAVGGLAQAAVALR